MLKKATIEDFLLKAGYSAKAAKLYVNRVNVGSIENPDVTSTYTGLLCGDTITLYLKLEDQVIIDAKFEYSGCAGTATSGSALTMLVTGKTVGEAWKITKDDVLRELGGLPESHCADLAVNALHKALEKLKEKQTTSV
ncbi:iron-sulfur cluster assembly scaffold protein [Candidatus Bathyarchaeota archaeon A05DMB-2]|jgi:nitrogen fixation NifU-like protein|nr:iron-sulfur cluster assembly scaffold protein [Candidatus Bathyarchaeota archaeon A05DMB-2]